ncbi:MAG: hypothetical protein JXA91_05940 [Candidatus Thermoplasmatota archaeon]|nr:hypothetical protein [Candidatus Thermoplasmatota archaeon]
MKLSLRFIIIIASIIILASIGIAGFLYLTSNNDNKDIDPPSIQVITGNLTVEAGKSITIVANYSDDVGVVNATLHYRSASSEKWQNVTLIDGTANLNIPKNAIENWYYFVTVDDEAGNGPVGDPSNDGIKYYTISVNPYSGEDLVHTVLIEEASTTFCAYCPEISQKIDELYKTGNYNFYYVSLVSDKSRLAEQRLNELNIADYPTVYIDGGYKVLYGSKHEKSSIADEIENAQNRDVPKLNLSAIATLSQNKDSFEVNITIENFEQNTYNGKLKVYLVEKISNVTDNKAESYRYYLKEYIIEKSISISSFGRITEITTKNVTGIDYENLMIIAVVFSSEAETRYSKPPSENSFNAYFADATAGVSLVESENERPEVGFTSPKKGKLHIFGIEIGNTLNLNTVVIGKMNIEIQASDDSKIDHVILYIDGNEVKNFSNEPYTYKLGRQGLLKFKHTLKVVAVDDQGKSNSDTMELCAFILFKAINS